MMTTLEYGLTYLSKCWTASGRPTISMVMGQNMLENGKIPLAMQSALKKLKVSQCFLTWGKYVFIIYIHIYTYF